MERSRAASKDIVVVVTIQQCDNCSRTTTHRHTRRLPWASRRGNVSRPLHYQ